MSCRGVLLIVAVLFCASSANAQIKPKIMIIFDTSGSMLDDDDRDGSPLCNDQGQSSRVYQLKVALFETLQGIGATEVDFALSTFPMFVDPSRTPVCSDDCNAGPSPNICSGHYYVTNSQDAEWADDRNACKVSSHDTDTEQTADCATSACPWYNDYKNEVLKVPFGSAPEDVMLYFDQQEDAGSVAVLTNPEVRAGRSWWTPLGKSLFYAHGYFDKEVALPASDYRKSCEKLVVAMFTDGEETCNFLTNNAFYPTKWAANLLSMGVVVHTVAIDTSSGMIQDIANAGGGSYYNVAGNAAELKVAFLDIIAKAQPPTETCNNADDDCDNEVDEDFPLKGTPCNNGLKGACQRAGVFVCSTDGSGVVCDAEMVSGTTEVCDGIDNDCDNEIDEIPGCIPCVPQPEVCNDKDDDCDGDIDEDIPPAPCGSTIGECSPGTTRCENGKTICEGGQGPTDEVCDGKDNDCDGQRDGIIDLCYPFEQGCDLEADPPSCQPDSQCLFGNVTCEAKEINPDEWIGEWTECTGAVGPDEEVCDGIDNDCDGEIDEDAECPGESQCINGMCTSACAGGEFVCPVGQVCTNGWCVVDPCDATACKATGGVCKNGECIDLCKDVTCNEYQKCEFGVCVDDSCYEARPCDEGSTCIQGECVKDSCETTSCASDEFCLDGKCHTLCEAMSCPDGQICELVGEEGSQTTKCVKSSCAGKTCNTGYVCIDGTCVVDPCEEVDCGEREVCINGECIADPCERIDCPDTHKCVRGACVANISALTEILATGGGGCACDVGGDASGSIVVLLLLLLAIAPNRRRE